MELMFEAMFCFSNWSFLEGIETLFIQIYVSCWEQLKNPSKKYMVVSAKKSASVASVTALCSLDAYRSCIDDSSEQLFRPSLNTCYCNVRKKGGISMSSFEVVETTTHHVSDPHSSPVSLLPPSLLGGWASFKASYWTRCCIRYLISVLILKSSNYF